MSEKWIDEWFEKNENVLTKLVAALKAHDKKSFVESCPANVHGWYLDYRESPEEAKSRWDRREHLLIGDVFAVTFVTGGMGGGNCWGDEARSFTSQDYDIPEEGFHKELVFRLMEESDVPVKLSDMAKISRKVAELEKEFHTTEYEYYGNSNDLKAVYLQVDELYDFLKEYY